MDFLDTLLGRNRLPSSVDQGLREEADQLILELIEIGRKDDYLSEHPGGGI